jgi:hypothetical protein
MIFTETGRLSSDRCACGALAAFIAATVVVVMSIGSAEGWSFYIDQRKFTDTGGRMHQIPAYEVSSGGVKSYREP